MALPRKIYRFVVYDILDFHQRVQHTHEHTNNAFRRKPPENLLIICLQALHAIVRKQLFTIHAPLLSMILAVVRYKMLASENGFPNGLKYLISLTVMRKAATCFLQLKLGYLIEYF